MELSPRDVASLMYTPGQVLGSMPQPLMVLDFPSAAGPRVLVLTKTLRRVDASGSTLEFLLPPEASSAAQWSEGQRFNIHMLSGKQINLVQGDEGFFSDQGVAVVQDPEIADSIGAESLGQLQCTISSVTPTVHSVAVAAHTAGGFVARSGRPLVSFQGGVGEMSPMSLESATSSLSSALSSAADSVIELVALEVGAECSLITYDQGSQIAARVSNFSTTGRGTQVGERFPVVPPVGALFVDSTYTGLTEEAWLGVLDEFLPGSEATEAKEQALLRLARVQQRGWSIIVGGPYTARELDELTLPANWESAEARLRPLTEAIIRMGPSYEPEEIPAQVEGTVHAIAVPVSVMDETAAVLRLSALPLDPSRAEIENWISLLQQAATDIGRELTSRL